MNKAAVLHQWNLACSSSGDFQHACKTTWNALKKKKSRL